MQFKNWKVEKDDNQITWVYFDKAESPVNTFNIPALEELNEIVDGIKQDADCRGVIITSAKKTGFVMGADIDQFTKVTTEQEAYDFVKRAHNIFDKIEVLKVPSVALINGICLGGGTELALSCRYRVADENEKTKIGLPEILLGIFPGWGGSVRLPKLVGALTGMNMMLTGKPLSARAALKVGLVDKAVPARYLKQAAVALVLNQPAPHQPSKIEALTNSSLARRFLAKKMRQQVMRNKARKEHYPAPYALIENWEKYGVGKKALEGEMRAVANLVVGDTAQNLIRVFFLQQQLKGLGKGVNFPVKHVHVIGAGTMGGDIAAWCALRGMKVTLQDREHKYIAPAMKRAAALYAAKLKKPELVQQTLDRLVPDVEGLGVPQADVVIEAIFENLEAKQALFKDLENRMKKDAVMASNTSSIPLEKIAEALKHPERLVGIHFFNPVAKMMLVEVVKGEKTSEEVVQKATAFVRAIDRLPLPVKSYPGFLVNRILMPYLMESLALYQEGVPANLIDQAALKFGMPMGPIELADKVGLDICLHVAKNLSTYFGSEVPSFLEKKVQDGELGVKTGKGFYQYDAKGKRIKTEEKGQSPLPQDVVADRLILRYLNEAAACLRENIIDDKNLLDAGMIFGTGFAPFRGGPIHYAEKIGVANVVEKLKSFKERFGDRYAPDAGWDELTK